jgi:hypothetical protein
VTSLVRSGQPDDDIDALRARMTALDAALDERRTNLARTQSALEAFRIRYRQDVGTLHEKLDELELAIAEAELGEMARRLTSDTDGPTASRSSAPSEPAQRFTSDAVRRLFRDVAKTIHPDLAHDEVARDRRHTLMVEANRAYALGDEERLRSILDAWERSPEAVQGDDPEAARQRLVRRIAQIEDHLNLCAAELASLQDSPLWRLKVMVDDAAARGKDLVADMVRRLKRDIMAARNRLDAMQWSP